MPLLPEIFYLQEIARTFKSTCLTKSTSCPDAAAAPANSCASMPDGGDGHRPQSNGSWRSIAKEVCLRHRLQVASDHCQTLSQPFLDALPMSTKSVLMKIAKRYGVLPQGSGGGPSTKSRRPGPSTTTAFLEEYHTYWQQQQELLAKARLRALKENDTEAYFEHLRHTKISSLLRIMELTHAFMTAIGAQLDKQQQNAGRATTSVVNKDGLAAAAGQACAYESSSEYRRFKEYVASTKDEYKLVHKSPVFVERQPSGLRGTLMPHQLVGLRFLASLHANNINGILADEMGVGKTIQTLSFLLYLKECGGGGGHPRPHLVLAPLSIIREWKEACETFVPDSMRVAEFGEAVARGDGLHDFDIVLLAAHSVRNVTVQLSKVSWGFIVVDEAHKSVSNLNTITAQAICGLPYQHRLVLTGTPLNSDLQELWSLLHFINPKIFSEMSSFDDVFRRPFQSIAGGDQKEMAAAQLSEEERALLVMRLHQVIRPFMLRRTKKDIDQTLKITFHEVRCPLTFPQTHLLEQLRSQKQLPCVIAGECVSRSVLTIETSAQAICNHAFMIPFLSQVLEREKQHHHKQQLGMLHSDQEEGKSSLCAATSVEEAAVTLACSGKLLVLDLLLRRARSVGVKTVVFTHWLDCIDLLTEYFDAQGWQQNTHYVALSGSSTAEERKECVDRFRGDPECTIFLVSMKAGGCGLNLQVTHLIVMLDRDYTGTNEDQAIARVFRIGQKNVVRAIHLLTNDPCEQRIADIAERKNKPRHAIIEGGGYHVEAVTEEERRLALLNATATGSAVSLDLSTAERMQEHDACFAFDHLIVPERATRRPTVGDDDSFEVDASAVVEEEERMRCMAQQLRADTTTTFRAGYFAESDVYPTLRAAFTESQRDGCASAEGYGRGKRDRSDFTVDDLPPDAFWNRLVAQGVDEDEIQERWLAKRAKERELASLCTVKMEVAAKTVEMNITEEQPLQPRRMPRAGFLTF